MERIGTPGGLFVGGDPATNTKGTTVTADWLNTVQEELANIVEGFGGTLDPEDNGQLFDWLIASLAMKVGDASQIFQVAAAVGANDATPLAQVQSLLGAISQMVIATTAEAQAMVDNTKALSPLRLKEALQGANQSLASSGYQKLPGGMILQWIYDSGSLAANTGADKTWPIAFPNACLCVWPSALSNADGDDAFIAWRSKTTTGCRVANGSSVTLIGYGILAIGN
ncbi:MAG: hypothetical protein OEV91_03775 [Desulfobulbaceae bacterium]|nr:hypothetical protein [Desulfobulbaceae bacterium]